MTTSTSCDTSITCILCGYVFYSSTGHKKVARVICERHFDAYRMVQLTPYNIFTDPVRERNE